MCYLPKSLQLPRVLEVGAAAPILEMGKLRLREVIWEEDGPGNSSYKDQKTRKYIAVHETALWREKNEGGGEWGPCYSSPPTTAHMRTTGPSGETSRKESFASTK